MLCSEVLSWSSTYMSGTYIHTSSVSIVQFSSPFWRRPTGTQQHQLILFAFHVVHDIQQNDNHTYPDIAHIDIQTIRHLAYENCSRSLMWPYTSRYPEIYECSMAGWKRKTGIAPKSIRLDPIRLQRRRSSHRWTHNQLCSKKWTGLCGI